MGTIGHGSDCQYDAGVRASTLFAVRAPFLQWMPFVILGAGSSIRVMLRGSGLEVHVGAFFSGDACPTSS